MTVKVLFVCLSVLAVGKAARNPYPSRNGFGSGRNNNPDRGGALGSDCLYDDHCNVDNAFCQMQMQCRCKRNYEPNQSQDSCVAKIGADCRSRFDCSSLENGECRQNLCGCMDGFIPYQERACLRGKCPDKDENWYPSEWENEDCTVSERIGDACQSSEQCQTLGKNAKCINGRCTCDTWEHKADSDGKCYPNKGLGQSCDHTNECFIAEGFKGTVHCRSGICQCKEGYHQTQERTCAGGNGATSARFSFVASVVPILLAVSRITQLLLVN